MRIISIVTLISPTGEYGGPVRVALNQARALLGAGHEVTVAAGSRGFSGIVPREIDGVPIRLFPARTVLPFTGFAGLAAPGLQRWLKVAVRHADVLHIHVARDFVTLPAAALARRNDVPYVVQSHGMIDVSHNPLALPLDLAVTRRVLRSAKAVFYLTERERSDLVSVAGDGLRLRELPNGVPPAAVSRHADSLEVLYLARLARRKRPAAFVEAALALSSDYPDARFTLVGPDEGEGSLVRSAIHAVESNISWEGPLAPELTLHRMSRASIYVLPATNEPYPMSVLEAMSVGLPVIVTETCGLAAAVAAAGCGIVVDHSVDSLTRAIRSLLSNPDLARSMGEAGRVASREVFGMGPIAAALEREYARPG